MGRRVLLLSVNQYDFPYTVFPLGLAQVDAALVRAGHVTRIVDFNVNLRPVEEIVSEFQPDVVGVSLRNIDDVLISKRDTFFDDLPRLVGELRLHSRAPIVLGGSGFSIFPTELLTATGADYGIHGEGEDLFPELIEILARGGDPRDLSGLVYRKDGTARVNPRSGMVAPKDIPCASRQDSFVEHYLQSSSMLNLQTQRGCAFRCCYCTYPLLEGTRYRRRPADAVADELEEMEKQGVKYVFIVDSVFNTSASHVSAICEAILKRKLQIKWCCFLRPKGLTRELMQLMVRAGLKHVEFGSDSFSDAVLHEYGKGLEFDDILQSSRHAAAAKIDFAHFLICGGPGETMETLNETFANSRRLPATTIMARVGMRVYPGTPLYQRMAGDHGAETLPPLLEPVYYISPALSEDVIFAQLRQAAKDMPNWIFDDPPPGYFKFAERLRTKGFVGPLWSYFPMLQRLGKIGETTPSVATSAV
jgi:radical SAM superfamily enzyme YgiQ (UPF0313 family)